MKVEIKDIKAHQRVYGPSGSKWPEVYVAYTDARFEDGKWRVDVTDGGDYAYDLIEGIDEVYDNEEGLYDL